MQIEQKKKNIFKMNNIAIKISHDVPSKRLEIRGSRSDKNFIL